MGQEAGQEQQDFALIREIERLRAALKPFAEALTRAETLEPSDRYSRLITCCEDLTLFEFAQARTVLERKAACRECKDGLPSLNWKNGKPYSYCPECGREDHS